MPKCKLSTSWLHFHSSIYLFPWKSIIVLSILWHFPQIVPYVWKFGAFCDVDQPLILLVPPKFTNKQPKAGTYCIIPYQKPSMKKYPFLKDVIDAIGQNLTLFNVFPDYHGICPVTSSPNWKVAVIYIKSCIGCPIEKVNVLAANSSKFPKYIGLI